MELFKTSNPQLFVDNLFLYLLSMDIAGIIILAFFWLSLLSQQNIGWAAIGILLWFYILFIPFLIFLSIITLIVLKIILRKYPITHGWKLALYPIATLIFIGLLWVVYQAMHG